ncbi:MAG: hypothetical protein QOG68_2484 [Solirubrobacteraceae bacterium]|nr:hypothetical protein [Solirubrobacteraceae bacterium]
MVQYALSAVAVAAISLTLSACGSDSGKPAPVSTPATTSEPAHGSSPAQYAARGNAACRAGYEKLSASDQPVADGNGFADIVKALTSLTPPAGRQPAHDALVAAFTQQSDAYARAVAAKSAKARAAAQTAIEGAVGEIDKQSKALRLTDCRQ